MKKKEDGVRGKEMRKKKGRKLKKDGWNKKREGEK
jgi:hypothetical protein